MAVVATMVMSAAVARPAPNVGLEIYPAPEGVAKSGDFGIKVRLPDGEWREVPAYVVQVDMVADTRHVPNDATMAFFDFSGAVEFAISCRRETVRTARVRPSSAGVNARVEDGVIRFSLASPQNLSVEVNGDIAHNLHLFAGALTSPPLRTDPQVVYFGPGVHTLPNGSLRVASGQTLYFAGGAVIRGSIVCDQVENVRICGRGYFDQPRSPITIVDSRHVTVEGLIASRSIRIAQSEDVTVRAVKTISHGAWGDGIDVYCSNRVLIEGVFLRTSDDCIAVYAHRNRWFGDCRDVTVRNATLWADVAHPILVGTHGNPASPETIEHLAFENIDILDHCEGQIDYQGCLSLNASDANLIRDVRFENIRIDDFRRGQLVNLRVAWNRKYASAPGRGIEDVRFKDITYRGTHANLSIIAGYDDARKIRGVVFENLVINGRLISDRMPKPEWYRTADMANIFVGEHVEDVVFLGPGERK